MAKSAKEFAEEAESILHKVAREIGDPEKFRTIRNFLIHEAVDKFGEVGKEIADYLPKDISETCDQPVAS